MSVHFSVKKTDRKAYDGADRYTVRQFIRRQSDRSTSSIADVLARTEAGKHVFVEAKAAKARAFEAQEQAWRDYCDNVQALMESTAGIFGTSPTEPGLLHRWDIYQTASRRGAFHNLHAHADGLLSDLRYATVDPDIYRRVVTKLCGSVMGYVPESVAKASRQARVEWTPAVSGTRTEIIDKLSDKDPESLSNEEIALLSAAQ